MDKTYNPKNFEDKLYAEWEKEGYFKAVRDDDKVPFTVMMPPPNVTGVLHMGHAMDETLQDTVVRFKRMQGYCALWLPGTDHASIATEVKVVEKLAKEGIKKEDLTREEFLRHAWDWKEQYGGTIVSQLKKLGCSCDWSRLAFTMDEKCSKAVREAFVNLYNKKLIYRGNRIINWCPTCKTAISDAEVEYEEEEGRLWHLKYRVEDSDDYVVVATTRPETMFGDTAVAVNPKDERYRHLIGKKVSLPVAERAIPIVGDEHADMTFGTGCVKITPAHDPNDFEVGQRHSLEVIRVMNDDGTMNERAGKYEGQDRYECRKNLLLELKEENVLVGEEAHAHNVGHCYRCGTTVEPIVSRQWFVKMEPLARPAINAVMYKKTAFIPERFAKTYYNWMENVKDWCISRQLWWGHRIPVWYCKDCGAEICEKDDPVECPKCGSRDIVQDEDVLDTWFSSALWPFSTLGYPDDTSDLEYFYPTDLLVTGYDIIFFWVARMMFSGLEHMRKVPFHTVLIHGLVRDEKGAKMSKSAGNGVNPLDVIDKYGCDSLRFSLMQGVAPGNDTRYSDAKVEACSNFMNKIWNASRFVIMNCEGEEIIPMSSAKFTYADKWIMCRLQATIRDVTLLLNKYELGIAAQTLYDFVWDDFCDWYIEFTKSALWSEDKVKKSSAMSVLVFVLTETLKLLHPFVPFITDEIYREIPGTSGSIMVAKFPTYNARLSYKKEAAAFDGVIEIIKAVRTMKKEVDCPASKKITVYVMTEQKRTITSNLESILRLAGLGELRFISDHSEAGENAVTKVVNAGIIYIPLDELVDVEAELKRLDDELEKIDFEIGRAEGKLANQGFLNKAPKKLIDEEVGKRDKYMEMRRKVVERINTLKKQK
ncbi:MAG: valine--tRNA ligase [Clostridia bacterium]|nr:valine--tRNA ligase [Clostridia bacterium]